MEQISDNLTELSGYRRQRVVDSVMKEVYMWQKIFQKYLELAHVTSIRIKEKADLGLSFEDEQLYLEFYLKKKQEVRALLD